MSPHDDEIKRLEATARAAIKSAFGTAEDEYAATMFVTHHLEVLEEEYWVKILGTTKPDPQQILDVLKLRSHWAPGDFEREDAVRGISVFDFTLPGEITDYVISVRFDDSGVVESISMES